MSYRKLERLTLWVLTIIMLLCFISNTWTTNTVMNLNTTLIETVESNRAQYDEVLNNYKTMVHDLKVENALLKEENRYLKGEE